MPISKSDRRKSKKRAEAEEDNPVIKGLDDVDKALYEKALQYRYGLPVLCEVGDTRNCTKTSGSR